MAKQKTSAAKRDKRDKRDQTLATPQPQTAASWFSSRAVRETIEMILKAQRRWSDLVQKYTS